MSMASAGGGGATGWVVGVVVVVGLTDRAF